MRNLLIALGGFLLGSALIAGVLAVFRPTTVTVKQAPVSATPASAMLGSGMMSATAAPASARLTIQHVLRGCHVWSNGSQRGAFMRVHLMQGQRLAILDQDVDAHQMLQFAGPARVRLGAPMMMNHGVTLSFPRAGTYRLGTKTVEMPGGMSVDAKTIGPDNHLRLVVTVA